MFRYCFQKVLRKKDKNTISYNMHMVLVMLFIITCTNLIAENPCCYSY